MAAALCEPADTFRGGGGHRRECDSTISKQLRRQARPGGQVISTRMLRRVTTYSTPRPAREVQLPTAVVLRWLAEGRPMRLSVSGNAVDAYLWFPARPALVEPARLAAAQCDGDDR